MKENLKQTKGITLIALIITVIVLLILAVVSIRLVMNNGILGKAESATTQYGTEEEQEQIKLGYSNYQMAQASGEANPTLTVAGATTTGNGPWAVEFKSGNIYAVSSDGKTITSTSSTEESEVKSSIEWASASSVSNSTDKILSATENTKLKDEYGNKIVVPAGFKIKVDDDTNNATHVTEGIVVTDETNEFVWIPVGNIKTSTTDTTGTQITLGRYSDFTVGTTPVQTLENYSEQIRIRDGGGYHHFEDTSSNHTLGSVIAKNIGRFLESSVHNGGYYLGRYEARTAKERTASWDPLTTLTENKNDYVYNYVTQAQASERCQGMYTNKPFTSDLTNSYAWDTAIMFIENFGGDSMYASKTSVNSFYSDYANKGTSSDKISNIYDMASNCWEWSTESSGGSDEGTYRGGSCRNHGTWTSFRYSRSTPGERSYFSFRPVLYM